MLDAEVPSTEPMEPRVDTIDQHILRAELLDGMASFAEGQCALTSLKRARRDPQTPPRQARS